MRTSDFDYHLPASAIGQPPPRRDRSRLLVLDRKTGKIAHHTIRDLPTFLARGDVVVVNDTKVFRARLHGTIDGKPIELLLVRPNDFSPSHREGERPVLPKLSESEGGEGVGTSTWLALGKPGKRFRVGTSVTIGQLHGVVRSRESDGSLRIAFDRSSAHVIAYANRIGEVPTPPYVATPVRRLAEYQTAYARHVGSVAAPTAGFHLTPRILRALHTKGVHIARVTLHVGLGTFQPIRTERIEDHTMHAEWSEVPTATVRAIVRAKENNRRVIAIGTTTLRALEGASVVFSPSLREGELEGVGQSFSGWINLFIAPGFRFRVVDTLLTNFHLPASSLLVLVSAFAKPGNRALRGRDLILRAYRAALHRGYGFYSFGDAMLIR